MYNQYLNGWVKNHSVGMRYVKMELAINSEAEYDADEKAIWDKYNGGNTSAYYDTSGIGSGSSGINVMRLGNNAGIGGATGDTFTVEVVGDYKYKQVEATATDGSNIARAIYISANDGSFSTSTIAATTDTSVIALVRGAAIVGKETLTYGASIDTTAEKTKMYSELEAIGIICRSQIGSFPVVA